MWQLMLQHAATRSRWHHNVIISPESIEDAFSQFPCRCSISRVARRLTTARLRTRNLDPAASQLKQFDRGKAYRWAIQIHETSDEQRDARFRGHIRVRPSGIAHIATQKDAVARWRRRM